MARILDKKQTKEPGRSEKEAAWQTAIGIQAADGLRASEYIWQLSQKNINGKISIGELKEQLNNYYWERNIHDAGDPEKEEADKVAANITGILLSETFDLSAVGLASLHKEIYNGVYENAGTPREIEVSKKEWVLGGDILSFASPEKVIYSLEQCLEKERQYRYDPSDSDEMIAHLVAFISKIWQICPFGEGNTRFTAVLTLLHLRKLGICYKIDTFKNDSWYFHNALVRANYRNIAKNIDYEPVYLERFFRNLLLSEQWDLRNRYVHVRPAAEWSTQSKLNDNTSAGQEEDKNDTRKIKGKDRKKESKAEDIAEITRQEPVNYPDSQPITVENRTKTDKKIIKARPKEKSLENTNMLFLLVAIGEEFLSVKEIMEHLHLKGRDNFLKLYLNPAVVDGIVSLLYPQSPRHPRQKYLLTQKGLDLLNTIKPEMRARIERHLAKENA